MLLPVLHRTIALFALLALLAGCSSGPTLEGKWKFEKATKDGEQVSAPPAVQEMVLEFLPGGELNLRSGKERDTGTWQQPAENELVIKMEEAGSEEPARIVELTEDRLTLEPEDAGGRQLTYKRVE